MKNFAGHNIETPSTQSERVATPSRKGRRTALVAGLALGALAVLPGCSPAQSHKSVAPVSTPDVAPTPSYPPNATLPGEVIPSPSIQPDAPSKLSLSQKFCTPAIKQAVASEVGLSTPNKVYCEEVASGETVGPQAHFVANGREITISVEDGRKTSESFKQFYSDKSVIRWGLDDYSYLAATKDMGGGAVESKIQSGNRDLDILETGGATATNGQIFAQTVAQAVFPIKHRN